MKYEIRIPILDKAYIDQLVTALVRQGHNVYFNDDEFGGGAVCFTIMDDDLTKLGADNGR